MLVYVVSSNNKPLMPCKAAKARKLLRDGRAEVVSRTPFVVRLLWDCEEGTQSVTLGVDSGYNQVGLSVVTDKKEVYASKVNLRSDIVKLNSERRQYRRARRQRKT